MKVTQEVVTVWTDPLAGEVNFVLSGFRITLTADEATHLANALAEGVDRLHRTLPAAIPTPMPASSAPTPPAEAAADGAGAASPTSAETEAIQYRTRALIQASIREKGLSLREEERV